MSQISMHNESSLATIHWSQNFAVSEAVKHLAAVLRLLSPSDQLKMMVRLESFLDMDDHVRYLAVVSSRSTGSAHPVEGASNAPDMAKSAEEVCILGIDVAMPVKCPGILPAAAATAVTEPSSQSVPASPVKAQRSHSTVSPDHHHHQTIGSRIASRARKFMTLPKQKSKPSVPSPSSLAQRPSVSSSRVIRLDELSSAPDETDANVHLGLTLPIWADSKITLDGDGGFRVESKDRHHCFKPVSVQAMWSVLQTLLQASENARHHHQLSPAAWSHRNLHLSVSAFNLPSSGASISSSSPSSHSAADLSSPSVSVHHLSHEWVDKYSQRIDSQWCKEWHLILEDYLTLSEEQSESCGSKARRPLSPHLSRHRQQTYSPTETKIRQNLRDVMLKVDLEQVNSKEIRSQVEKNLKIDLSSYKSFIDHEILVILGQMDKASEIFDYLYLGTEWNASNLDELTTKDIGLVLNVTTEINNSFPDKFEYRNIRVNDVEEEPMVKHWEDCFRYISEAKKERKRVLVHCKMGVSRSASVVIAYTMKANDWNLEQAMRFVQQKRGCVKPNPGFMKQLEEYEGILEASKHRTSFQSGLTGSTLSLCDTRTSKYSSAELDELLGSNLRRASSEFFSVPNLSPSVPQRSVSLNRKSRLATFYLEKESDSSPEKQTKEEGRVQRRSKKEKKAVQWEPIAEVNLKEDTTDDTLGLIRVVVDSHTFRTPEEALAVTSPRPSFSQSADKEYPLTSSFCLMRQAASSLVTTIPKVKVRQSRLSASSAFGLSNAPSPNVPTKEPGKLPSGNRRPVSVHVSSYLKAKDPVQTLVKYFDELTHTPAGHSPAVNTTHLTPAPQAAQV